MNDGIRLVELLEPYAGIHESKVTWKRHLDFLVVWPLALIAEIPVFRLTRLLGLNVNKLTMRNIRWTCPVCGLRWHCPLRYPYDGATAAPDLHDALCRESAAFPIHDRGWELGTDERGTPISFDHNNAAMLDIMLREGHPLYGVRLYARGVTADFMRRKWESDHGMFPHAAECTFPYMVAGKVGGAMKVYAGGTI